VTHLIKEAMMSNYQNKLVIMAGRPLGKTFQDADRDREKSLRGHDEVVRLLVEHGARPDMKDTTPGQGTPASWARHEGHKDIEEYLQTQARAGLEKVQPD